MSDINFHAGLHREQIYGQIRDLTCGKYLAQDQRDPERFPNVAYHNVNINSDRNAALADSKRFLDEYYGPIFAPSPVEAWTGAGTPSECIEHLRKLAHDGAKSITFRITSWHQQSSTSVWWKKYCPR